MSSVSDIEEGSSVAAEKSPRRACSGPVLTALGVIGMLHLANMFLALTGTQGPGAICAKRDLRPERATHRGI